MVHLVHLVLIVTASNLELTRNSKPLSFQTNSCFSPLQAFDQNGDLVDLDVNKKLDAIFDDFVSLLKLLKNCATLKNYFVKMPKTSDWENLKIEHTSMKFLGLVGSNSWIQSYNRKLLNSSVVIFKIKFELEVLEIEVPMVQPRWKWDESFPIASP